MLHLVSIRRRTVAEKPLRRIRTSGARETEALQAQGDRRGMIFLTPHLGCFEMAPAPTAPSRRSRCSTRRRAAKICIELLKVARTASAGDAGAGDTGGRAGAAARAAARRGDRHPPGPGPFGRRRGLGAFLRPAGFHHDAAGAACAKRPARRSTCWHLAPAPSAAAGTWNCARLDRCPDAGGRSIRRSRPSSGAVPSSTSGATTATRARQPPPRPPRRMLRGPCGGSRPMMSELALRLLRAISAVPHRGWWRSAICSASLLYWLAAPRRAHRPHQPPALLSEPDRGRARPASPRPISATSRAASSTASCSGTSRPSGSASWCSCAAWSTSRRWPVVR